MRTALTACCLLVLTACGGSTSPVSSPTSSSLSPPAPAPDALSADELLVRAREELRAADSVRVRGSLPGGGDGGEVAVDLTLVGGAGGSGTLTLNGFALEVVRIDDELWFRAPRAFYEGRIDAASLDRLEGRFAVQAADDPSSTPFSSFTDLDVLTDLFLANIEQGDGLRLGEPAVVEGQSVVALLDEDEAGGTGVLYVTAAEPVRLVRVAEMAGADPGRFVDFLDYDVPVELTPPPPDQVVDLQQPAG